MLVDAELAVLEFHEKHGFRRHVSLGQVTHYKPDLDRLREAAQTLKILAKSMQNYAIVAERERDDDRLYRTHLMLEELSELISGLANCDEVELADAITDLLYVVIGTGVNFNLPLSELFDEVHRSNMTKDVRRMSDPRMRDKGSNYEAPDIEGVLDAVRQLG